MPDGIVTGIFTLVGALSGALFSVARDKSRWGGDRRLRWLEYRRDLYGEYLAQMNLAIHQIQKNKAVGHMLATAEEATAIGETDVAPLFERIRCISILSVAGPARDMLYAMRDLRTTALKGNSRTALDYATALSTYTSARLRFLDAVRTELLVVEDDNGEQAYAQLKTTIEGW